MGTQQSMMTFWLQTNIEDESLSEERTLKEKMQYASIPEALPELCRERVYQ